MTQAGPATAHSKRFESGSSRNQKLLEWRSVDVGIGCRRNSLPFEFRIVRLADLAWLSWLASLIALVVLAAVGEIGVALAAVLAGAVTLVIDVSFVFSRFTVRARPLRFIAALTISPPMMVGVPCRTNSWSLPSLAPTTTSVGTNPVGIPLS